jgi:hypothetical protein
VKLSERIANRSRAWAEEAKAQKEVQMEEERLLFVEKKQAEKLKKQRISKFRKENKPFEAKENKHMGSLAVQLLITEIMTRGGTCAIPIGDEQTYDLIVDSDSGLLRVQVKSTWTCVYKKDGERCHKRCRVIIGKGVSSKTPYHINDADVIAIYVHPFKHWEILNNDQTDGISHSFHSDKLKSTEWGVLGLCP